MIKAAPRSLSRLLIGSVVVRFEHHNPSGNNM